MRAIIGVLGLLIVVAIVGLLAKTQLGSVAPKPAANTAGVALPTVAPDATPQQQSQQMQQQVKQSVEAALQTPRTQPDDSK